MSSSKPSSEISSEIALEMSENMMEEMPENKMQKLKRVEDLLVFHKLRCHLIAKASDDLPINKAVNKRARQNQLALKEELMVKCPETALSSWNSKSQSTTEYELVEALGCSSIRTPSIHHCNFIARPKNSVEAENKLFFAELTHDYKSLPPPLRCDFCCILGRTDVETGLCGCTICDLDPSLVQHPEQGGFTKKRQVPILDHLTPEELDNYLSAEWCGDEYYSD